MKLLIFCGLLFFALYAAAEDVEKETKSDDVQTLTKRAQRLVYKHIGCFRDTGKRALPVYLGFFRGNIAICARLARAKGYSVFSVQYGGQCFTGPTADRTYKKYGRARNCKRGLGGTWANDVYRFPKIPAYKHIGCFRDSGKRALPVYLGFFRGNIKWCARLAWAKGYSVFSVQYGGQCFTGPTADRTYNKYGRANKCRRGLGGTWANDVYRFTKKLGRKFRKINRGAVCFYSKGNRPGIVKYYGPSRIVNGLMLVYRSGAVTCNYHDRKTFSRWGCGGHNLDVVVTDQYNYLIYPRKQYFINRHLWYQLPGKHSKQSSSLFFANVAAPFHLTQQTRLRVWYAEDLVNHTEHDNRGHVCVDVYAWFA